MNYDDFKQKIYSYLIRYKLNTLKISEKGTSVHGVELDCLFPVSKSTEKTPLMIYDGIRNIVEIIQKSDFSYKPHRESSFHVASSQTACINLFIPILESEHADDILLESGVAPVGFRQIDRCKFRKGYCFEYWDATISGKKGLLGDHNPAAGTDSDVAVAYRDKDGNSCLWLIEHKLTEREFTTCGGYRSKGISDSEKTDCVTCSMSELLDNPDRCYYHKHCGYKYWSIMREPSVKGFFNGVYEEKGCPFRKGMNQLWRNQLLALELERRNAFKKVSFSVVTHPENSFLDNTMDRYKKLTNNNSLFSDFKSNALVEAAAPYLPHWVKWYREVYLGISQKP